MKAFYMLETSRGLINWSIKLREFDIEYHPKVIMKEQAVVDFLVEFTNFLSQEKQEFLGKLIWIVYVDDYANKKHSRDGLDLIITLMAVVIQFNKLSLVYGGVITTLLKSLDIPPCSLEPALSSSSPFDKHTISKSKAQSKCT